MREIEIVFVLTEQMDFLRKIFDIDFEEEIYTMLL